MNNDERIENIEIKVAYLEDYVDKLNSVILDQQKEIDNIQKKFEQLKLRMSADSEELTEQEKPPHY